MTENRQPVLKKPDIGMPETHTRRGTVVYPQESATFRTIRAYAPPSELADFIEYFWVVRWNLTTPYVSQTIPQPRIHLTVEGGQVFVYGIDLAQFKRQISGTGSVLGVAFRPAGFRTFVNCQLYTLQDRVTPANTLFQTTFPPPELSSPSDADLVGYASSVLLAQEPAIDPIAQWCEALVRRADDDRTVTRVQHLAEIAGVSERSLQRRFADYVGASPKWVIQRSRIMNLVAECNDAADIDWAETAFTLGFADQAHLIRAFSAIVGQSPDRYLTEIRSGSRHT